MTTTVWGTFQSEVVKVRLDGETVPSDVLLELRFKVTLADGWVASTTVNSVGAPALLVTSPVAGETRIAARAPTSESSLAA